MSTAYSDAFTVYTRVVDWVTHGHIGDIKLPNKSLFPNTLDVLIFKVFDVKLPEMQPAAINHEGRNAYTILNAKIREKHPWFFDSEHSLTLFKALMIRRGITYE